MEKFFRIFFVSVISILLVSGIMYASSTIISVQTQSIAQGGVIANGWFQEVNDKLVNIFSSGGNVGIGTNTPNNRLQIGKGLDSTGSLLLARNSTSNDLGVYETYDGTDNFKLENQTGIFGYGVRPNDDAWQIWERGYNLNWTNYFTVTKIGNIGIGTTNPISKLTVAGMIETTASGVKFPDGSIQKSAGLTHDSFSVGKQISTTDWNGSIWTQSTNGNRSPLNGPGVYLEAGFYAVACDIGIDNSGGAGVHIFPILVNTATNEEYWLDMASATENRYYGRQIFWLDTGIYKARSYGEGNGQFYWYGGMTVKKL